MALYTFNDNFQINAPKHIDTRYLNLFTPWANTTAANAGTPPAYRYLGLTLLIGTIEYWYQAGVADVNLVPKTGAATSITANNLLTLTGSNLQLGGTIVHDTLLDLTGQNFKIFVNATSNSVSPFIVSNSGTATAILGQTTGGATAAIAIQGVAGTGNIAVYGSASGAGSVSVYGSNTNGIAGFFTTNTVGATGVSITVSNGGTPLASVSDLNPSLFQVISTSNSGVIPIIQIVRQSSTGGAPAIGIGSSIEFYNRMSNGSIDISSSIISSLNVVTTGAIDSQMTLTGVNASAVVNKMIIGPASTQVIATRFEMAQGAAVAAANNLTLGVDGNLFSITGNTQINAITTANWQAGTEIAFIFTGTPLLKNNTAGGGGTAVLSLAGGVDYLAAIGDYIGFVYNGTVWKETTRRPAAGGSAGIFTANNGLTIGPVSSNVQLGGALVQFTTIDTGSAFALSVNGSNRSTTNAVLNVSNNGTAGTTATGASIGVSTTAQTNIGLNIQVTNGTIQNYGALVNVTGTNCFGIQATADSFGLWGIGKSIGVFGQPIAFGTAGVKGDASVIGVLGVWGVGGIGVKGEGSFAGAGGGYFLSDGGFPLIAEQINSSTNNMIPALYVNRAGGVFSTGAYGTSIIYQLDDSIGSLVPSNEMVSVWNVSTSGSVSSFWTLNGVTNGTGLQPWITVSGATATFNGTGVSIVALNGTTGAFISGTNAGGVYESPNIPMQAANTSTSTNTVVTTYLSSRQGSSFIGAIGNGTQFAFDAKTDSGAGTTSGTFRNYLTNVTSATLTSQFDFRTIFLGTTTTVLTLTGSGKIIANSVANWIVAANNAAAISAGGVTGEFYRNGDIVQVVH